MRQLILQLFAFQAITGCILCQNSCVNCLYGEEYCHPDTSVCTFGCKPGWKGLLCTEKCLLDDCRDCGLAPSNIEQCTSCNKVGVYGPLCNLQCSDKCLGYNINDRCDHFGNCLFGCKRPYIGARCEEQDCPFSNCLRCEVGNYQEIYCWQCVAGYYWRAEQQMCQQCSQQCLNGIKQCDTFTGTCDACKPGYFGDRCEYQCTINNCTVCAHSNNQLICKKCEDGYFPDNSGQKCSSCQSQNCLGQCSSITGQCPSGCKDGWFGKDYSCNLLCSKPNCQKCALNFANEVLCITCNNGYYIYGNGCQRCPDNCLKGCETNSARCVGGCKVGFYGEQCSEKCNLHCLNNTCNNITGYCVCEQGWYGYRCDRTCPLYCTDCGDFTTSGVCAQCEPGKYGSSCEVECSQNCRPRSFGGYTYCHKSSGECEDGCLNGFYGDNCTLKCSYYCESASCDRDTGNCLNGCSQNHYGPKCDQRCPENCKDITAGYQRACHSGTGQCVNGCNDGFYAEFCNKTCNVRCKDNKCEQSSGECVLGCIFGYTGKNCDIICKTGCPNNNCSPNCNNNECDSETQLCTSGCLPGWHGTTCLEICGEKCIGRICNQMDGSCVRECVNGYYGEQCGFICNGNCVDSSCDKHTGSCSQGCAVGYHGEQCDQVCPEGCTNRTCDRTTGTCYTCGLGKRGDQCDEDCLPGTYGVNCALNCGRCKGNPCDIYTGHCPSGSGCEIGYSGDLCQEAFHTQAQTEKANMDIVIGSSVAGVVLLLVFVFLIICWLRFRSKGRKNKSDEPVVIYRDAGVTIQRATAPQGDETGSTNSETLMLGDTSNRLLINVQNELRKENTYTLYRGEMNSLGKKQNCVIKLAKIKDMKGDKAELYYLARETEIHSLCNSHINVAQLLTSYQNADVYCVAFEPCLEFGLAPYLKTLSAAEEDGLQSAGNVLKLVQFAIDVCSAVCHIHRHKVIHKMLQAKHIYLNDNLVAKVGDFCWAEMVNDSERDNRSAMNLLPKDSYRLLPPEAVFHDRFSYSVDIWCLGMLLWEIFSYGKQPFEGVSKSEYTQMMADGIRPIKPVSAHFTLYRIMKNCWRFEPEERPTAEQVLQQLLDIQGRFSDIESAVVHV